MPLMGVIELAGGPMAERLSERQRQCLALVDQGFTSKQIARELALSPSTVDNHLRAALERLGLNSRTDAARALRSAGGEQGDVSVMATPSNEAVAPSPTGQPVVPSGLRGWLRLPKLGGVENRLSLRKRYFHVAQLALLGTMVMTALVMTIAGLVHLFTP